MGTSLVKQRSCAVFVDSSTPGARSSNSELVERNSESAPKIAATAPSVCGYEFPSMVWGFGHLALPFICEAHGKAKEDRQSVKSYEKLITPRQGLGLS